MHAVSLQVIVMPHSAFLTHEALGNIAATTVCNMHLFFPTSEYVMHAALLQVIVTPHSAFLKHEALGNIATPLCPTFALFSIT
jgi:lactate dehydrogenase-like 2-hydroxyacid dehydrogenase